MVTKAHEFINVAAILFSQQPSFWGQGLRSIYYSALTLARIKDIRAFMEPTKKFHSRVWGISALPIRKYFDEKFKAIRIRYDYEVSENPGKLSQEDLKDFIREGIEPFCQLIDQAADSIRKDFRHCNGAMQNCPYCERLRSEVCLRDKGLTELEQLRKKVKELVTSQSRDEEGKI